MLVDSHCHLDFDDFDTDREAVLTRARAAGVGLMVTISTKITLADKIIGLAEAHEDVVCSVGIHPHEAGSEPETPASELIRLSAHPKVVGIGETGLDYYYEHSPQRRPAAQFQGAYRRRP